MNMNVSLPEELASFVKDKVASGRYGSSSEVVREALRLLENTERREAARLEPRRAAKDGGDAGAAPFPSMSPQTQPGKAAKPARAMRTLDPATERAAKAFLMRLEGRYPVAEGILYGSRARGDFTADSDADLAVILKGERVDRIAAALDMAGVAFDVMMETGVRVQGLPIWADELERPERFANPALIRTILREGVRL